MLFGEDVFISYARADGLAYAEALGLKLQDRGFSCCFDQWLSHPNRRDGQLPFTLRTRLVRSSMMVIVGTIGSARSSYVEDEIEEFLKFNERRGATVRAINLDGGVTSALWAHRVVGLVLDDLPERVDSAKSSGNELAPMRKAPSDDLLVALERSVKFTRRDRRQLRIALSLLAASVLGVVVAALLVERQRKAAANAYQVAVTAHSAANVASAAASSARAAASAARKDAIDKTQVAELAVASATLAQGKASAAAASASAAELRAKVASEDANSLEKVGRARALSEYDSREAVQLALSALIQTPKVQQMQALRDALNVYVPRFDFVDKRHSAASCVVNGGHGLLTLDHRTSIMSVWEVDRFAARPAQAPPLPPGLGNLECSHSGDLVTATAWSGSAMVFVSSSQQGRQVVAPGSRQNDIAPPPLLAGVSPDGSRFFTIQGQTARLGDATRDELAPPTVLDSPIESAFLISPSELLTFSEPPRREPGPDDEKPGAPAERQSRIAVVNLITRQVEVGRDVPVQFHLLGRPRGPFVLLDRGNMDPSDVVDLVDLKTLKSVPRREGDKPYNIRSVLSPSGSFVVGPVDIEAPGLFSLRSTTGSSRGYVWRVRPEDYTRRIGIACFPPPNEDHAVMTWDDTLLELWDPKTGTRLKRIVLPQRIEDAAATPDGLRLFTQNDSSVSVWLPFPRGVPRSQQMDWLTLWNKEIPILVARAEIGSDGESVAYLRGSKGVWAWSEGLRPQLLQEHDANGRFLFALSPRGTAFVSAEQGRIDWRLRHMRSDSPAWSLAGWSCSLPDTRIEKLAVSDDGESVLTVSSPATLTVSDGDIDLSQVTVGSRIAVMNRKCELKPIQLVPKGDHVPSISSVAFADRLLVFDSGMGILLWDRQQNRLLQTGLRGHQPKLDPTGTRLLSLSEDGKLGVWARNPHRFDSLRTFNIPASEVKDLAWSADGKFAATISEDNWIRVWDLEFGTLAWSLAGTADKHGDSLLAVAFKGTTMDIVSVWAHGAVRVDPCETCRGPDALIAFTKRWGAKN